MIDVAALVAEALMMAPDDRARHGAVRCIVDWAGCALAGSTHPAVTAAAAVTAALGTGEGCTMVGRPQRSAEFGAALVNGTASHVLDFDDVNVTMIGHPAVVIVPAAVAVAEASGASGEATLDAIVAGYEIAEALGAVVNPGHYERGWHATSTLGCAAAATAVAGLLGLDASAAARAVSVATTQAGGVRAMFGTHGKSFHAGRAAATGVLSGYLARAGLDVPTDVWSGAGGYLRASGAGDIPCPGGRQAERGTESRSGDPVPAILRTAFKGHAACGATHCAIDAVAGLVADHQLVDADIAAIELRVHRLAVQAAGIENPTTALEGKFSLRHTAAQAVLAYPLLPPSFTDEAVNDPRVVALRERVRVDVDELFAYEEAMPARVRMRTATGAIHERYVDTPRGRPGNPMTDQELTAKFTALAEPVLGAVGARRAVEALWAIRSADAIGPAMRTLSL